MLQYVGFLKEKSETKKVSATFQKRTFILTDNAQEYPQFIEFELTQLRCNLIDDIQEGEEVKVQFQLKGRFWTNPKGERKQFNTLDVIKVKVEKPTNFKGETKSLDNLSEIITPTPDNDLPF